MNQKYDHKTIEAKWAKRWKEAGLYKTDIQNAKNPYYLLMMFPYPSGEGLHAGHTFTFSGGDVLGHMKLRQGKDLFEPMGFDSFGIHSENYAIKVGGHPADLTKKTIKYFRDEQFGRLGMAIDWSHELATSDPKYYKWTQWLFIQLYKAGLAYRKEAAAQWCPSCLTVLADEQVIGGHCERCDSEVTTKTLPQWFFKITDYADRLLENLKTIDWTETTKTMQKNWIGRSEGAQVIFKTVAGDLPVFTTRPDTLWGATFMVVSPEHPILTKLTTEENREAVQSYVKQAAQKSEVERMSGDKDKTGVFTGSFASNPVNGKEIPIWVADYVLMSYGTGAIMAVPGHDTRDWAFAKKYDLPIVEVIDGGDIDKASYVGEGKLVNSGEFDGTDSKEAAWKVINYLEEKGLGKKETTYHLRDWLISRQRYWGPPIPMIYCEQCGTVSVPEDQLPVLLPEVEDFKPTGTGTAPLASVESFVNTTCPKCGGPATRETDVSDTFLDSSWYFLRYPSTEFDDKPFDKELTKKWLPVDTYIGGNEHAVLHLLYTRFVTMVLKDLGFIDFEEPFKKFRAHGLVIYKGAKMSKSRGNVVNPNEYFEKVGTDVFRTAMLFMAPYEQGGEFKDEGVGGVQRYFGRVIDLVEKAEDREETPEEIRTKNVTIKKVTEEIESLSYNTAIAALMEYSNVLGKAPQAPKRGVQTLVSLLAVFAPHLAEELWERLGGTFSIHKLEWPSYDEKQLVGEKQIIVVQVNGKLRDKLELEVGISEEELKRLALDSDKVKPYTISKEPDKMIYVPGKLVNFVIN